MDHEKLQRVAGAENGPSIYFYTTSEPLEKVINRPDAGNGYWLPAVGYLKTGDIVKVNADAGKPKITHAELVVTWADEPDDHAPTIGLCLVSRTSAA